MRKTIIGLLIVTLLLLPASFAVPTTLNVDFQIFNETGIAKNTTYDGTIRIYESGAGGATYTVSESWTTDNDGVAGLLLTNLNLADDVQYELTVQPTGESESDRINVSPVVQAIFAANASFASSGPWSGLTGVPAGLDDGDDDTIYTDTGLVNNDSAILLDTNAMRANYTGLNLTFGQFLGFSCGAGDYVDSISILGLPSCSTPAGGGGGAGDKWVDNGTFISPNATFADNVWVPGWLNITGAVYSSDWTNVTITESQISDLSHTAAYDDSALTANDTTLFANLLANWTYLFNLNTTAGIEALNFVTGAHTTDTNAGTICASGEFLNGDTTCDTGFLDADGTDDDVPESGDFGNAADLEATGALSASVVSDNEIDYSTVTLADFTNDANYAKTNTDNSFSSNQSFTLNASIGGASFYDNGTCLQIMRGGTIFSLCE